MPLLCFYLIISNIFAFSIKCNCLITIFVCHISKIKIYYLIFIKRYVSLTLIWNWKETHFSKEMNVSYVLQKFKNETLEF